MVAEHWRDFLVPKNEIWLLRFTIQIRRDPTAEDMAEVYFAQPPKAQNVSYSVLLPADCPGISTMPSQALGSFTV